MKPQVLHNVCENLFKYAVENEESGRARVVAALVHRNQVIIAPNSKKTHPFQKRFAKNPYSITLHAETHVIVKALQRGWDLDQIADSTLVIVRAKRTSPASKFVAGLAKPCCGCFRCIVDFGIETVYYSTDSGLIEKLHD